MCSSFLVINVCNQGKTLCSPCITVAILNFSGHFSYDVSVPKIPCIKLNSILTHKKILHCAVVHTSVTEQMKLDYVDSGVR